MILNKKAIAPVIAAVLLIGIVVAASGASFLWFKSMTKEAVIKFGENIELVCEEVQFDASLSTNKISVTNNGNVPIESFLVKAINGGEYSSSTIDTNANVGDSVTLPVSGGTEYLVIPILVGESESGGQKTFTCDDRYGVSVE